MFLHRLSLFLFLTYHVAINFFRVLAITIRKSAYFIMLANPQFALNIFQSAGVRADYTELMIRIISIFLFLFRKFSFRIRKLSFKTLSLVYKILYWSSEPSVSTNIFQYSQQLFPVNPIESFLLKLTRLKCQHNWGRLVSQFWPSDSSIALSLLVASVGCRRIL